MFLQPDYSLHTGLKGACTRALCHNNEGSVEFKQRPIEMDGRTIYRTLSPERTPFQTGMTDDRIIENCLE
jgi:hypothetical protein